MCDICKFDTNMAPDFKTNEAYDSALLGILSHEAAVQPFIDVIFSFLSRKTDFYRTMKTKEQSFGFPPGVAEKMVMNSFKKYQVTFNRTLLR